MKWENPLASLSMYRIDSWRYALDMHKKPTVLWVMYLALSVAFFCSALRFHERLWSLLMLTGCLILSFTVRHMALSANGGEQSACWLAYLVDIALVHGVGWQVGRDAILFFYIVVLCDACISCARPFGYLVACLCLASYALSGILDPKGELVADISVAAGVFSAAAAIVAIARQEMETRRDHDSMHDALKTKSKQLEDAYAKLKESVALQEEMTALKERVRISGELHDTVGHALVAGLYSLEAGERLLASGDEQAAQHIALAAGQIRNGLRDLRQTVHAMSSDGEGTFASRVQALLEQTRSQGIFIRDAVCDLATLSERKQAALLLALKEGFANGIRHGGGTAFVFSLAPQGETLHFLLEDNGRGTEKIIPGFGLTTMARRVGEAGGTLTFSSQAGEGFRIEIDMPWED